MKRNKILLLLLFGLFVFLTACSSNDSNKASEEKSIMDNDSAPYSENEMSSIAMDMAVDESEESSVDKNDSFSDEPGQMNTDRMIIHQARLQVNVKDLEDAQLRIEKKVREYGGYIVESNLYLEDDRRVSGYMTVRIPEKHFQRFLTDAEDTAADILERSVTGQDITEEYVDLESRVKSKRTVEERLLSFMVDAKKTDDLLKISSDLARVQEDIEVIVGRMNFLENQSAYSTVEISMYENRIIIPELENKDLDTWEKTKKQLATSLNFILVAGSSVIIFLIGNLPVFIILLLVGSVIYFFIKRRKVE